MSNKNCLRGTKNLLILFPPFCFQFFNFHELLFNQISGIGWHIEEVTQWLIETQLYFTVKLDYILPFLRKMKRENKIFSENETLPRKKPSHSPHLKFTAQTSADPQKRDHEHFSTPFQPHVIRQRIAGLSKLTRLFIRKSPRNSEIR